MILVNNFRNIISGAAIAKWMLLGAAVGLVTISSFIFPVDQPDPSWDTNWRMRPLILTPLVAAIGALAFLLPRLIQKSSAIKRFLLYTFSTFSFLVALWLGIIIGLDGTLWN